MVVGSGLVAGGFKKYANNDEVLIFASGVSNSGNIQDVEFEREKKLLQQELSLNQDKTFVYLGTCSVYDASLQNSAYVMHKLAMEAMIKELHGDYHIFRVSNLAGKTSNPNTVLNFFYQHIISGSVFDLWLHASRNIIDIDDAVAVCSYIIDKKLCSNEITNIANPVNYPVAEIVKTLETISGKKANYTVTDKGSNPDINTHQAKHFFSLLHISFDDDYLKKTLEKYYSPHDV